MKTLATLLTIIILVFWIMAVALLSVQNATPVSLKFLSFQSIQLPVGLLLAFCAAVGMIGMGLLQPLWRLTASEQNNFTAQDDAEFFVDDEDF
ncbi:MAG: LapA family protein [Fischerella sp. CENA71]|nr:LapA family protein [Fischerella sp. CENA71]